MPKTPPKPPSPSPSELIDARIAELPAWQGEVLARIRRLIHQAVPEMAEEWKWRGVPVWSHHGILCTGETYKQVVKLTFARGASLADPAGLFNASLDGNTRRAIDLREGDRLDARAFKALVRAAAAHNASSATAKRAKSTTARSTTSKATTTEATTPALLSGGNPQIAKGYGDAPVQAYIEAMPGWKRDVGRRVDAVITAEVPGVRKAVKWNSPMYGLPGRGWLVNVHVFARFVRVTFFAGAALRPPPPGAGKDPDARWIDVHEDGLDEARLAKWVKQAARRTGWVTADIAQ